MLHNAETLGMEAASNLGIRSSESAFIAIHDDDDEWRQDFLFPIGFIDGEPRAFWNQRPGLTGKLGNSVIDRVKEHRVFDEVVRENYLKKDDADHGLGMMSISMMHREVLDSNRELRDQLAQLEAAISDASLVSLLRRRYRRLKDRMTAKSSSTAGE